MKANAPLSKDIKPQKPLIFATNIPGLGDYQLFLFDPKMKKLYMTEEAVILNKDDNLYYLGAQAVALLEHFDELPPLRLVENAEEANALRTAGLPAELEPLPNGGVRFPWANERDPKSHAPLFYVVTINLGKA